MKKSSVVAMLVIAGLLLTARTAPTATTTIGSAIPLSVEITEGVAYTSTQMLDVYAPTEPEPWPVVVIVHGLGETKAGVAFYSKDIANQGAVVFAANWYATMPSLAAQQGGKGFRQGFEDIACAVRFARTRASDYGGDPKRVTLVGWSAGAAAGAWLALSGNHHPWLRETDCFVGVSALPDAFVGIGGCYNFADFLKEKDPELWELVSPYAYIGNNPNLQVRLIHGEVDSTCPVEDAAQFHEALEAAGYDVTLTVLEQTGHSWPPYGEQMIMVRDIIIKCLEE